MERRLLAVLIAAALALFAAAFHQAFQRESSAGPIQAQELDWVPLAQVPLLQPDDDVKSFTLPRGRRDDFAGLAEGAEAAAVLRVAREPWGLERPRCLCERLAVYSPDGARREALVVEPRFGSEDLQEEDAAKLLDAARAMLKPAAAVALEQVPVFQPDNEVREFTVPHESAQELASLAAGLGAASRLRVAREPWGDVRPKCICEQLAVYSPDGVRREVVLLMPGIGSQDLQGEDAAKLLAAARAMAETATGPTALAQLPLFQPDFEVSRFTLPHSYAQAVASVAAGLSDEARLRVAREPWGLERPRCLCDQLAVYSPDGARREALVVEPGFGSEDLGEDDAAKLLEAVGAVLADGPTPLSRIPLLQADAEVMGFTLPDKEVRELLSLAREKGQGKRLRVAIEPWGATRPYCPCWQLAVYSPDHELHSTVVVEPRLPESGAKEIHGEDAGKLVGAARAMIG